MKYIKHTSLPIRSITTAVALTLSFSVLAEGDIEQGKAKAISCVGCHGADGLGKAPGYPNLQGQKAAYLEKQLKDFRDGSRTDPFMAAMARPLSDQDIADLAIFFSSLK